MKHEIEKLSDEVLLFNLYLTQGIVLLLGCIGDRNTRTTEVAEEDKP